MKSNFSYIAIILLTFFISCTQKKKLVENKIWKFRSGYSIGDAFNIDNNYTKMTNDTIYVNGMAIALFVNFERRFFADNILTIKSIKENHIGEYCEK